MARFNIEGRLHRLVGRSKDLRSVVWIRNYGIIDTAVRTGIAYLIAEGQVGDIIEFTLKKISGLQVATLRYRANGKIDVEWNYREGVKLRNARELERTNPNSIKKLMQSAGQLKSDSVH